MINTIKLFKINKFNFILLLSILAFSSCSDDISLNDEGVEGIEFGDRRGRGGERGGNNNNDNNGVSLSDIDSELLQSWTDLYLDLEQHSIGRPNAAARSIAYIFLATYEVGVPGMSNYSSNDSRLRNLRINNLRGDVDLELALNTAYADVLQHFLRGLDDSQYESILSFEKEQTEILTVDLDQREIEAAVEWGEDVASQVIRYSQTDDDAEEQILDPQPRSYEPEVQDGYWTYSADPERALFPYWESTRTFVISPDETSTVEPLAYSTDPNSAYFQEMEEVLVENDAAKAAQGEQLHIAEFWSDDVEGLMMSPPARQISIANQLIAQYELNLEEALVLMLKVGFALNDAAVSAWKYKYQYMVMRPSNYIHEFIDPDFQTNLYRLVYWPNPSFPGYPSGHSTFASAAGGIFIDTFGDDTNFTDRTHEGRTEFLGTPRTFTTFSQMADENGYSRIPLGVHPRMDCTEGLRLGYEIANAISELRLGRPL